ncbi:MAG TPA: M28 family peptidase, partial [Armatimonadetes bacterium]|nr:M28 family peptidase [Armatimonadota bacterium]
MWWRRALLSGVACLLLGLSLPKGCLFSFRRLKEERRKVVITLDYKRLLRPVTKEGLKRTVEFMASLGSRVAGYPGNYEASRYVERKFREAGLRNVRRERFKVVVPFEKFAYIELSPEEAKRVGLPPRVRIHALWPNLVRTCTTPPQGIRGPLIYAGYGSLEEFNHKPVEGSIALLEFNCGSNWYNAPLLGVKAVLFIEPLETQRGEGEAKFLSIPLNIPRFWVPREVGLKLKELCLRSKEPPVVTVKARVDWEEREVWNILADLPGTDPKLRNERVVVSAYFDSISVVPALAPGAEAACGIAAMLELAKALAKYPQKRPVTFLATNAHFLSMEGVKRYFWNRLKTIKEKGDEGKAQVAWLFLGLDLTSHERRFGLFYKAHFFDYTEDVQRRFADYGKQIDGYVEEVSEALGIEPDDWYVNAISPIQGKEWRTYIPGIIALESEVAVIAGCPGLGVLTVNDGRQYVDTPLDTPERVDFDALYHQVRALVGLVARMCNEYERKVEFRDFDLNFCRVSGRVVEFDPRVSYLPEKPVGHALTACRTLPTGRKTYMGVRGIPVVWTTPAKRVVEEGKEKWEGGEFEFIGVPLNRVRPEAQVRVEAYVLRDSDGELIYAPDLGSLGAEKFPIVVPVDVEDKQLQVVVFKCRSIAVFDTVDQRYFELLKELYVYDATTNAEPISYGFSLPIQQPWLSYYEPCALIYAPPDVPVKITMGASELAQRTQAGGFGALRMILLNSDPKHPLGKGFLPEKTPTIPMTPLRAVYDMWLRDEDWIAKLRKHGIENLRVNELHSAAKKLLERAFKALRERKYDEAIASARAAWGFESDAYPNVKKTANDVVKGVIFYLMLLLPFAFFAERLFFGFPDIRKQIPAVLGIFIFVFLVLRFVHPAFDITTSPLVVLEAFIILALAILVVGIIVGKFEEEMRQMKFATTGIHQADVGRISAAVAAFNLGISNMRRRKARTALTCITLILLTFTVLSFTSVVSVT